MEWDGAIYLVAITGVYAAVTGSTFYWKIATYIL